jgi:hypothetical protein
MWCWEKATGNVQRAGGWSAEASPQESQLAGTITRWRHDLGKSYPADH